MINVIYLCVILTNGFDCSEYATMAICEEVRAGLDRSVVEKSDCTNAEIRKGSVHAPEWSPVPPVKP